QFAARNRQVARPSGTGGENDGVELLLEFVGLLILADLAVGNERDSFVAHQLDPPLDDALRFELHGGDAVHQQAADAVGPREDGDVVTGTVELGGGGQARRPAADDGDLPASARGRRSRLHPAFLETAVNDAPLNGLDGDRRLIDAQRARAFAGGGADTAGELG